MLFTHILYFWRKGVSYTYIMYVVIRTLLVMYVDVRDREQVPRCHRFTLGMITDTQSVPYVIKHELIVSSP
jgi:hypothetical protein